MTQPADTLPASPGDEKWLGGRKWTGLAAVIILGVLLVAAGGVVLFSDKGSGRQTTAPTATARPTSGGSQNQSLPTSAPANVTWTLWEGIGLPVSGDVGPTQVQGSVASGYSHSPTGALIAAAQLAVRVVLAPDADWRRAVEAGTVPGPGREAWIKDREPLTGKFDGVEPGRAAQLAGFQFTGYSPDLAVITLVNGDAPQGYRASTVTLVWRSGDWKVQQGPDGLTSTNVHPIADLSGFVPWSGAS
jgi:hypothetical protein